MKTRLLSRRLVLLAAAAPLLPLAAHAETVRGNGKPATQQRSASGFTGVAVSIPAQVELRLGAGESVQVEADENLLPLIETVVKDGMLEIRPIRRNLDLESRAIKVTVQARRIEHLAIGGSGSIHADALKAPSLELDIGGSGSIVLGEFQGDRMQASVGGSGSVRVQGGSAKSVTVSIGGSGGVDAAQLQSDKVQVSIGGSGDVKVWAQQVLSVSIAGSGNVQYWGDPSVASSVVGSGRARRMGSSPR